jgi:hypothetical protein
MARNWRTPPEKVRTVPSTVACAFSAAPVFEKHATLFVVPVCPEEDQPSVVREGCEVTPPALTHVAAPVAAFVHRYTRRGATLVSTHWEPTT